MSESRLYLYRKAGRDVWDAEMWLPDGRRRVWRTGIVDKSAAMEAARVRLETLAAVQSVAPIDRDCMRDGCAPAASAEASVEDETPLPEQTEARVSAATVAPASADKIPLEQVTSARVGAARASGEGASALQTQAKAHHMGALGRFDRWFFKDLASLWQHAG